ncbi:ArgP/LysG family DNA-binding transcriptional regulator [Nocardia aurantiaca]|uniref:ArgP/LysG family DNA-binding transcriptional regulator n=1 Tax=Nocardia aurantiaca TaxID=2675850 RepID=UPI002286F055|nr:ArgP/LysG family DNA-binding transcriptional regulator [Nocardia aurantiaca]
MWSSGPARPTQAGQVLSRLAQQLVLLTADANAALREGTGAIDRGTTMVRVSLAINADSVSTWFQPVISQLARERSVLLDLHIEDQDHTETLLRRGDVMAAVTTSNTPASGCSIEPLGAMTYSVVCAPSLLHGLPPGQVDVSKLPMVRFDLKDDLQHAYLRMIGAVREPPIHYIPSNREFLSAVQLGLGWGALPDGQISQDLADGRLVSLDPDNTVQTPLFLHRWRFPSATLDRVTEIVRCAARAALPAAK